MSIDWFTFTAQIVNFLILVWLLRRFLYGPIVNAMQAREDMIAARLEEADARRQEAEQEAEAFRGRRNELDQHRESLLEEAKQTAHENRKRLLEEAREEVRTQREAWLDSVAQQRDSLIETIRSRATTQLTAAMRRALSELADVALEERVAERFIDQVTALDDTQRQQLIASLREAQQPAVVRSAFALPEASQSRIRAALQEQLGMNGDLTFKTSPEVICGIELQAGGRKLGWSVNEFLAALEDEMQDALPTPVERS